MKIVDKRSNNMVEDLYDVPCGEVVTLEDCTGLWFVTDESSNEDTTLLVCLNDGMTEWRDNKTKVTIVRDAHIVVGNTNNQTPKLVDPFDNPVMNGSNESGCGNCGDCDSVCGPSKMVKLKKKKK